MQIVQPRLGVVVIPPIPERIERADNPLLNRCRARLGGNRAVAPCVIGIGAYLGSVFRVDGDDVPLQILLEVVGVKRIRSIGLVSVLQPDGSAVLIIEVYQEVVRGLRATTALRRPCLGDDLGAVQRVVVDRTAVCLDGSDALGVIREGIQELSHVHGHLHEFATVPLQRIPVVGGGVAEASFNWAQEIRKNKSRFTLGHPYIKCASRRIAKHKFFVDYCNLLLRIESLRLKE